METHYNIIPSSGGEAIPNTGFGTNSGPILASNIACNGSEYDLYMCRNTTEIPSICTHERDAAVSCQPGFSKSLCDLSQSNFFLCSLL